MASNLNNESANEHLNGPILLVEDNAKDVALTKMAFHENNIKNPLVVAKDGVEALEYLFGAEPYDNEVVHYPNLILLDLKLPKVDGLEVLQKIRKNPSTALLPVVILTSSKEDTDLMKGYQFGANAYVRKPVDFVEFSQAVKNIGLFWLLVNENPPHSIMKG